MKSLVLVLVLAAGCSSPSPAPDAGAPDGAQADAAPDALAPIDATTDAPVSDAPPDATSDAGSCLDAHAAGERYPAGDGCNFCDCAADGSTTCTTRTCAATTAPGCDYDGVAHAYAERFPSTDGCNECVCAASGLACTRRTCPGALEEGAVLLESPNEPCGGIADFTAQRVLDTLPYAELTAPFLYERARATYPETRADTTVSLRIAYDGGYAVCRVPMPGQEAIDLEVAIEWVTADGAFDEGFHAYLRRNAGGFVDAWWIGASAPPSGLHGTYTPACPDAAGFAFAAQIDADGSATGSASKTCEGDILLDVGTFTVTP